MPGTAHLERLRWLHLLIGSCIALYVVVGFVSPHVAAQGMGEQRPLLTLAVATSAVDYVPDAVARFASLHNVDVDVVYLPASSTERIEWLTTRYVGGVTVDVFYVVPTMTGTLYSIGAARDLTPFLESDPNIGIDDFIPAGVLSHSGPGGEVLAIPTEVVLRSINVNNDLIEQAGLLHPNQMTVGDWDWARFEEYGRKLTQRTPEGTVRVAGIAWSEAQVPTLVNQAGGYIFSHPSTPGEAGLLRNDTVLAIETWARWFTSGVAVRSGDIQNHSAAMSVQSSTHIKTIIDTGLPNWDVVNWPHGPDNNAPSVEISGFMMHAQTRHPQLAWELIKFLATDEGNTMGLIESRVRPPAYIPNIMGLYTEANFPNGSPPGVTVLRDSLIHPKLAVREGFAGADDFYSEMAFKLRYEVASGERPARLVLEDLQRLAESILRGVRP